MMYEELFQSADRPFRATPDARFYFPYDSLEAARQTVVRAVQRAEGPVMVLGGAGLGKSLLCDMVAGDVTDRFDVVKLHAARLCSRKALLQSILFELQLPYRELSEGELRLSILDRLVPADDVAPEGVLVIVDEAHTLPVKLLEELRLITNFTRDGQPRIRLVLMGSLRLEDTFATPQLESFNQRLAARCYLTPMSREQTQQYVEHQIATAGYPPREFITSEGLQAVYAATEGVPRLVNQVMDHALVLAITNNQCPMSSALIEEAWADLQQLPAPWQSTAETASDSQKNAIEFGALEDEDSEVLSYEEPLENVVEDAVGDVEVASEEQQEPSEPVVAFSAEPQQPGAEGIETETKTDRPDAATTTEVRAEADEPAEEEHNFFSAFAAPTQDELPGLLEYRPSESTTQTEESLCKPEVVFDASLEFSKEGGHVDGEDPSPASLPPDSFFEDRPTDEKLIALAEEQAQYDAMGVWENDPPLPSETTPPLESATLELAAIDVESEVSQEPENEPLQTPVDDIAEVAPVDAEATSLFGDDFDEEVPVTLEVETAPLEAHDTGAITTDPVAPTSDTTQPHTPEVAQHLAQIQQFADQMASGSEPGWTVDDVLQVPDEQPPVEDADEELATSLETWSVDVARVDVEHELAVHNEIEDIVSQLNFSAFAVEPYSVEQISLDPEASASEIPDDSIRRGGSDSEDIYMMHRAEDLSEQNLFTDAATQYDDDRDLLIVEEELPVKSKAADSAVEEPVTKTTPYSQLFAKLRK